jgi:hypothetical protein
MSNIRRNVLGILGSYKLGCKENGYRSLNQYQQRMIENVIQHFTSLTK